MQNIKIKKYIIKSELLQFLIFFLKKSPLFRLVCFCSIQLMKNSPPPNNVQETSEHNNRNVENNY